MPLPPGTRLGPYEISAAIGAGGMGEVYRAKDARLDRTVAIKILPPHLSSDPELRARFEREARVVSALSHPHICAVHDVGRENGLDYLVMELLEGETLADRLAKGPMPLPQALRVAVQIADALDRAHRAGVVHRDLKPGNVILTRAGAKLLDFGLAKSTALPAKDSALSALATEAKPLTEKGTVLGTVQYMSPEQLEGRDADARSDVFAFGAMLFELVTGKRAFAGTSQASLIGAILRDEPPPISSLQALAPPALERVVATCLAKDPDERWQSAHDLANELRWIAQSGSQSGGLAAARPTVPGRRVPIAAAVGAALVLAAAGIAAGLRLRPSAPARPVRASVLAPAGSVLESRWPLAGPVAVSPDGTRLVFTARKGEGVAQLWVRALDDAAPHPVPGTDGATLPFWSPDGRFVAFAADGKLRKVDVNGGPVSVICDVPDSRGATWNRDDVILFSPEASSPIFSVPAGGGTPRAVTTLADGDTTHRYPYFLPDGKHFLYLARKTYSGPGREPAIRVGELGSKVSKKVVDAASNAVYASGFLLYVRQGTLVAQPFDAKKLVTTGEPSPVVEGVRIDDRFSRAVFSVSDNGVLACQTGKAVTATQFVWLDRTGRELGRLGEPAEHFNGGYPVLSPDGKRLAVSALDPGTGLAGVWLVDVASGARTRLSVSTMDSYSSAWSPDGARLAMRRSPVGSAANARLVVRSIDGSGLEQELGAADGSSWISPVSWSPDGAFLLEEIGSGGGGTGNTHLAAVPVAGGPSVKLSLSQGHENMGQFSPDGRLIAYVSDESGRRDVYVAAFPGPGGKWQVSQDGGTEPRWRRDGKELFFFAPDNRLMAAEVTLGGGAFQVGAITPLFQTRAMGSGYRYDAAPDGRRFLVNTALPDTSSPEITLLLNWPEARPRR